MKRKLICVLLSLILLLSIAMTASAEETLWRVVDNADLLDIAEESAHEETIRLLRQKAPWCKIMVGGAVLNPEYAASIGADFYTKDAMEAVRCAEGIYHSLSQ